MKAATHPAPTESHPPLAHDQQGNLLPVPDGTSAWRVCRHTGGRPRVVSGPDGQPLRLPLQITRDDLAEMCGADTYRVYGIDELGNVLGHVTTVEAGREVEPEPDRQVFRNLGLPVGSSDLRYALEAITHMARTNSDALRAIAESQADWVTAIAAAKGLPRNVAFPPPQLPPPPDDDDDDDEDDEDEGEPAESKQGGVEAFVGAMAPFIPSLMSNWSSKPKQIDGGTGQAIRHLARIRAALTPKERDYLDIVLTDPESGEAIAIDLTSKTVDDAVAMIRHGVSATSEPRRNGTPPVSMNDPALLQKVAAVSGLLKPDERARLMALAPRLMNSQAAMELVGNLLPLSHEAAAEWLRANLDEVEARFAS